MKKIIKISKNATLHDLVFLMSDNKYGVVLLVDDRGRLLGTLTDGDLRCAILKNNKFDAPIETLLLEQKSLPFKTPVTAKLGTSTHRLLDIMTDYSIHHIPIVDDEGVVVDLATRDELEPEYPKLRNAVIVAGGRGERMRPLTDKTPKPMLPLNGKPMIEHVVVRLRESGIETITISTGYKSDHIIDYFQNGKKFGVEIRYVHEDKPLGTAGFLRNIEITAATLVINADVLTSQNFRLLYAYHRRNLAQMTVAVRAYTVTVPYGVAIMRGVCPYGPSFKCMEIAGLEEKPTMSHFINAGIYLLEPEVMRYLPDRDFFNMTDLIEEMVKDEKRVASFPMYAYWRDLGSISDYTKATKDMANGCL